jgi:hypothetical protein
MAKSLPLSGNRDGLVKVLKRHYLENAVLVKEITFDKDGNWHIQQAPRKHKESLWKFINTHEPFKNYRVSQAVCKYTSKYFLPSLFDEAIRNDNNLLEAVEFLEKANPAFMHLIKKKKFLTLDGTGKETWKLFLKIKKLL